MCPVLCPHVSGRSRKPLRKDSRRCLVYGLNIGFKVTTAEPLRLHSVCQSFRLPVASRTSAYGVAGTCGTSLRMPELFAPDLTVASSSRFLVWPARLGSLGGLQV
jgi:hypothetical protein